MYRNDFRAVGYPLRLYSGKDALEHLHDAADIFLVHDRDIVTRVVAVSPSVLLASVEASSVTWRPIVLGPDRRAAVDVSGVMGGHGLSSSDGVRREWFDACLPLPRADHTARRHANRLPARPRCGFAAG